MILLQPGRLQRRGQKWHLKNTNLGWKHRGVSPWACRSLASILLELLIYSFVNGNWALLGPGCEFLSVTENHAPQRCLLANAHVWDTQNYPGQPGREGNRWPPAEELKSRPITCPISLFIRMLPELLSTLPYYCSPPPALKAKIPGWIFLLPFKTHSEMPWRSLLVMQEGKKIPAGHQTAWCSLRLPE